MQQNKQTVCWGIKSVPELLADLALCCHCSTNFCQSFHLLPGLLLQLCSFCRCRESPPAQSPLCKPCFAHDSCMNKNPISQFTLLEGILQGSKKSAMTQVFSLPSWWWYTYSMQKFGLCWNPSPGGAEEMMMKEFSNFLHLPQGESKK